MRNLSRFIPGEEIEAVSQWSFGSVDTDALLLAARERDEQETRSRLRDEAVRQEAFALGMAQGLEQGRAQTLAAAEQRVHDHVRGQGKDAAQRFAGLIESSRQRESRH